MDEAQNPPEIRHAPTVARVYGNDNIEVTWEPSLCIHVGACFTGSLAAFDPNRRPWVDVNAEPPDRLAAIIRRCPTGALHYRRLDGAPQEQPREPMTIDARPNGPLIVRGDVEIVERGGKIIRHDTRVALCRCGGSSNKPFCDGTHRVIGFRTEPEE